MKPENNNIRTSVLSSVAWLGTLKYSGQILTWIITIIVIRKLDPGDFGLYAEANIFIALMMLLSELGFGTVIVQRKELDESLLRQIFGFILLTNIALALITFISAPLLARYFSEPRLIEIFRVLSSVFIIMCFYSVPHALLRRKMNFKSKSIVDLIAACGQSIMTLILAFSGFGVWSLVWGGITMHIIFLVGYNVANKFPLLPSFRFKNITEIISFGGYLTGSNFVWFYYTKADILIGGYFLESKLIGQFSVAKSLASLPMEKIYPVVTQVALPAYSKLQQEIEQVKYYFLKSIRLGALLTFPLFAGLAIVVPEIVEILLGSRWENVVLPIQILCIVMPFRAMGSLLAPVLIGVGNPVINFKNVGITALILTFSFLCGIPYGVNGLCWAWVFGYGVSFLIIMKTTCSALNLKLKAVLLEISGPLFFSLLMSAVLYLVNRIFITHFNSILLVVLNTFLGVVLYSGMMFLFNKDTFNEFIRLFSKKRLSHQEVV